MQHSHKNRIAKQISEHVKSVLDVDTHIPDHEKTLQAAVRGKTVYIEILHEWGVAVRKYPSYPGKKTGEVLHKGTIVKAYAGINFAYERGVIRFYKLISGSGWLHNYNVNRDATLLEHSSDEHLTLAKSSRPMYPQHLMDVTRTTIQKLQRGKERDINLDMLPQGKLPPSPTFNRILNRSPAKYDSHLRKPAYLEPVRTTNITKKPDLYDSPGFNKYITLEEKTSPVGEWSRKNAKNSMRKFSTPFFQEKTMKSDNVSFHKNVIKTNQIRIAQLQEQHKDLDRQLEKIASKVQNYATLQQTSIEEKQEKSIFETFIKNLHQGQENEFLTSWKEVSSLDLERKTLYEYKQLIKDSDKAMKKLKNHLEWKTESIGELKRIVEVYAKVHKSPHQQQF